MTADARIVALASGLMEAAASNDEDDEGEEFEPER